MFDRGCALSVGLMLIIIAIGPGITHDSSEATGPMDSPWPSYHGDSKNTGLSPYSASSSNVVKWTIETQWSSEVHYRENNNPTIDRDGNVYFVAFDSERNEALYSVRPDGTIKWTYPFGQTFPYSSGFGVSIASSPALGNNDKIYVGGFNGSERLYCLNLEGELEWVFALESDYEIYAPPAIGSDGTIYLASDYRNLYAIRPNGTLKWVFPTGGSIFRSPAIDDDGTIYICSGDDVLHAIYPNGTKKWNITTYHSIYDSTPCISDNGNILFASYGHLNSLYPNGTLQWTFQTGEFIDTTPALDNDGNIYFGGYYDDVLYSLRPDGTQRWNLTLEGGIGESPAIDKNDNIFFSSSNYLYSITQKGSLRWKLKVDSYLSSSPSIARDGTLYVGPSANGTFYAIGPSETGPRDPNLFWLVVIVVIGTFATTTILYFRHKFMRME